MSIVEFAGMPRSGKTTTANILKKSDGVIIYPERFDLIPKELKEDPFKYNLWYAKYCVGRLVEVLNKPGIHVFERGVIDRIVHGKANLHLGRFTPEQFAEYQDTLLPHIIHNDLTFIFNISPSVSQQRAIILGKNITTAMDYLGSLNAEYNQVKDLCPDAVYLPTEASLEEINQIVTHEIKDLQIYQN